jgi:hypothetical protein
VDGWDTSDSMGAANVASVDGGGVVSSVEAEDCSECAVVETAESVEDGSGTSDSTGAGGSALAGKTDVLTSAEKEGEEGEEEGGEEEMACWLEPLCCEVTELVGRVSSFSEMRRAARSASASLLICDSKVFKEMLKARGFEAGDGSVIGSER